MSTSKGHQPYATEMAMINNDCIINLAILNKPVRIFPTATHLTVFTPGIIFKQFGLWRNFLAQTNNSLLYYFRGFECSKTKLLIRWNATKHEVIQSLKSKTIARGSETRLSNGR